MRKREMFCNTCLKFNPETSHCHAAPCTIFIENPFDYWCGQGQWRTYAKNFNDYVDYFWGEWDDEDDKSSDC